MTADRTPAEIATAYIEAWARSDMDTVARFYADDVVLEASMYPPITGAEAVLKAAGEFAALVTDLNIIAALGDDHQALVFYDMTTAPFGTIRTAEHLTISDGKIKTDTVVLDTHELRKAQSPEDLTA